MGTKIENKAKDKECLLYIGWFGKPSQKRLYLS